MTTPVTQGSHFFDILESKSDTEIISIFDGYIKEASSAVSEHEYLDYKNGKNIPISTDEGKSKIREEWAQAVSGFANADGGVVVWGIQTQPRDKHDIPKNFAYVPNPESLHGLLKNYLGSEISPPVLGVKFKVVPANENEGLVICYIPAGKMKPHESIFHHNYFMRASHQHIVVPQAVLRAMFYPQFYPVLTLRCDPDTHNGSPAHGYNTRLILRNIGPVSVSGIFVVIRQFDRILHFEPAVDMTEVANDHWVRNLRVPDELHPKLAEVLGTIRMDALSRVTVSVFAKDMNPFIWEIEGTQENGLFTVRQSEATD
jgi:hypothetical protein